MIGQHIAHYRVTAKIGAGGMGVVYQATDTKLGREVALKVLPDAFVADAQRMGRFQREAHVLASLNHPHIAAIYGLEDAGATRALVMELADGPTLSTRIAQGKIPLDEAVPIARQIAEALEYAHEKGIIHRDLKPANIKITPDGKVKLLDFGLAKALTEEAAQAENSASPTLSIAATRAGIILGTAAYMSPEQARGKPADRRADIWSFGVVLFELLSGKQAFGGETISDSMAAVIAREPGWEALPADTPPQLRELLRRCLHKDCGHRLRDIGDARIALEELSIAGALGASSGLVESLPASRVSSERVPFWSRKISLVRATASALLLALAASILAWVVLRSLPQAPSPLTRVTVSAPRGEMLESITHPLLAISPDARHIVFLAGHGAISQLYLRAVDQWEATPIPGSQGAGNPIFSPDGEWIAFFGDGKLKKLSVRGGNAFPICDASTAASRGASWSTDGWIYFTPTFTGGIFRVPEAGGKLEEVTTMDTNKGERTHRWPEVLPGGKALLYTIGSIRSPDYYFDAQIVVKSLATGQVRVLVDGGTNPRYVSTGHLVYATATGLLAAPFDIQRLEITGPPVTIAENVHVQVDTGAVHYAVSRDGTFAYVRGEPPDAERSLAWVDRTGKVELLNLPKRTYFEPALSPDGKRLAVSIRGPRNYDIWVVDLERGTLARLTFGPGPALSPMWTPDGSRIIYASETDRQTGLFWKPSDGSGQEERISTSLVFPVPESISRDGKLLIYRENDPFQQGNIMVLPLEGERKPRPFLTTTFDEFGGTLSPDGQWIAYVSNESGSEELYVQPFPGPGGKRQISTGNYACWSHDGRELFFRIGSPNRMMSVRVTTRPSFSVSTPKELFPITFGGFRAGIRSMYDLAPDSKKFLVIQGDAQSTANNQVNLVFGWADQLRHRAAGK